VNSQKIRLYFCIETRLHTNIRRVELYETKVAEGERRERREREKRERERRWIGIELKTVFGGNDQINLYSVISLVTRIAADY